jgi:hypothetical protein
MEMFAVSSNDYLRRKEPTYEGQRARAMVSLFGRPVDRERGICRRLTRDDFGWILRGLL